MEIAVCNPVVACNCRQRRKDSEDSKIWIKIVAICSLCLISIPQRMTMKILRLLHMIYPKHHNRMEGESQAVELVVVSIMTSLKLRKWPKPTVVHHQMIQTSITYKWITLVLLVERAPVARGKQQQGKVLEVVTRMD